MTTRIITGDARAVLASLPDASVHCVVADLSETQVAYIAGLIDGEGSLECQMEMQKGAATPVFKMRLSFGFATAEPITTVAAWLGTAPSVYPATTPSRQPVWRLHVKNRIVLPLLHRVLPHLILKRQQARLILAIDGVRALNTVPRTMKGGYGAHRRMPQAAVEQMTTMHVALRALKSNKRSLSCR